NQRNAQRNQSNAQRNQGNAQRSQGNGQRRPVGPMRGASQPSPSGRGRERSERVRDGRRPEQRAALPALPSEKVQQSVRQEQLEYHRHQQQAEEPRHEAAPKSERT